MQSINIFIQPINVFIQSINKFIQLSHGICIIQKMLHEMAFHVDLDVAPTGAFYFHDTGNTQNYQSRLIFLKRKSNLFEQDGHENAASQDG